MKQIRKSVFETNSSSTHAICVARNLCDESLLEGYRGKEFYFDAGCFGWEREEFYNPVDKAAYLWTALIRSGKYNKEQIERIQEAIREEFSIYDIKVSFKPFEEKHSEYNGKAYTYLDFEGDNLYDCYIDHCSNLDYWLSFLFSDNATNFEDTHYVINFIFDSQSFVMTGNDNDDDSIEEIDKALDTMGCHTFYKGN